jgi:hypothetical protein
MQWIVSDDIVRPDIVSLAHVSLLVVQGDVISMEGRRRWLDRCQWLVRDTCGKTGNADEPDDD